MSNIFKEARKDPEPIFQHTPVDRADATKQLLNGIAADAYVSIWAHLLNATFEYHIHQKDIAEQLQEQINMNNRSNHPRLLGVYDRKGLEITLQAETASNGSAYK